MKERRTIDGINIVIEQRSNDFIVYLDSNSNKGIWDCGKTKEIAIKRFLLTYKSLK